jgi:hypothetical protein
MLVERCLILKPVHKMHLGDASCISDGRPLCRDIHQHLWDHCGSETYVSQGGWRGGSTLVCAGGGLRQLPG